MNISDHIAAEVAKDGLEVRATVGYSPGDLPKAARGPYDLVFVDGLHTRGALRKDFEGMLPYLAKQAIVVCHDVGMFDLFPEILALVKPTPCNQRDFASIEGGGDSVSERFDVKASASGAQPLLSTLFGVKIVLDAFRETLIFRLQICNNESGEMGYGTRRRKIRTLSTHITVVSATATCWGPDFSHADSRTTRSWNSGGQGRNSSVDLRGSKTPTTSKQFATLTGNP